MGIFAEQHHAAFVISTGDNFYDDGVASVSDAHWKESFENVYTATSLQVPWYVVLGNHDRRGNFQAQIDYTRLSKRWTMPAPYFKKQLSIAPGTELEIFFLDTNLLRNKPKTDTPADPEAAKTQLHWLSKALARSTAQWKMVVGHHPIYSGGEHGNSPELIQKVLPLLIEHKVDLYCNGHDHDLQHLQSDGLNFFCSGAGSQIRDTQSIATTRFAKSSSGFMGVQLSPSSMDVQLISGSGEVLYSTILSKPPVTAH